MTEEQILPQKTPDKSDNLVDNQQNVIEQNRKIENNKEIVEKLDNTIITPEINIPVVKNAKYDLNQHEACKRVKFVPSILRKNKREETPITTINNQKSTNNVSDAVQIR